MTKRIVNIGILNLMPTVKETEKQLIKVLENEKVDVKIDFIYLSSKNYNKEKFKYIKKNYKSFSSIKDKYYDGIIITGAPLEHLDYEDVEYIDELKEFIDYSEKYSKSIIYLCWASQFGLKYLYNVDKYDLESKISGVYKHYIVNNTDLVKDMKEEFYVPQSRYCSINSLDVLNNKDLILVSKSLDSGIYIVESKDKKNIFFTGHAEYDLWTLDKEYHRDIDRGINPSIPKNYYKEDNPVNSPLYKWKYVGDKIYHNWIYYYLCDMI